jgi:hypothetical protein
MTFHTRAVRQIVEHKGAFSLKPSAYAPLGKWC